MTPALPQLVWDMDGTLFNSTHVVPVALVTAIKALGGPTLTEQQAIDAYVLGIPENILAHFLERPLVPGEEDHYYNVVTESTVVPFDGVKDTFAQLKKWGHPQIVFTGAHSRGAKILLKKAGLAPDLLVGGEVIGRPKPSADGIFYTANRLGIDPQQVIYIGDSPADQQAATAAGATSVAIRWGHLFDPDQAADHTLSSPLEALDLIADLYR